MNSRERVLAALNHQQPDRTPIDIGATRQSGIAVSTYAKLKEHLGIDTPTRIYDMFQMLAEIEQPILDRFGVDVIGIHPLEILPGAPNKDWKPWKLFDGTPVEVPGGFHPEVQENGDLLLKFPNGEAYAQMPCGGYYFDRIDKEPGAAHLAPEDMVVPILTDEECDRIGAQAEAYRENTDKAIVAKVAPAHELFFGLGNGDFSAWMITLALEPDYVTSLYERLTEGWLENLRRFESTVGDRVDVIQFNDDLGTQDRPFLAPDMFKDLIMPHYQAGLDWIHENTDKKVFMHSCGAVYDFIPMLIEMGVDALNPVQITASGMDPIRLKEEFGDKISFWGGGCNCQQTLPFGSPEEVRKEAEHSLEVLGKDGGFIFTSIHNIQANVPPENVIALFDTALGK